MELTTNERKVMLELNGVFNGDFGFADEIDHERAGLKSKRSLGGVVASLNRKGLVDTYPNDIDTPASMFDFTPDGRAYLVTVGETVHPN